MTTKTLGERLFGTLAHEATAKDWERACIILERDRAELIEALKMAHGAIMETNSAKFTKTYDLVGALLSRLGAA